METLLFFMKQKQKHFIFCVILAALGAVLEIVPYLMIYRLFSLFLTDSVNADFSLVMRFLLISLGAIILRYGMVISSFVFSHIAAFDLLYLIRSGLIDHLGRLPMGFWSRNSSGKVRKVIQEDVERIENFTAHHVPDLVSGIVLPIVTVSVLFFFDWRMALVTLVPLPIGLLMVKMMFSKGCNGRSRRQTWEDYHASIESMHSSIVEYVRAMPVVKVFNIGVDSFKRLRESVTGYRDLTVGISKQQSPYFAVFTASSLGGGVFIMPMGIYLLQNGLIDVPVFLLFLILGTGCFVKFVRLMMIVGHCELIAEAGNRIGSLMKEPVLTEPEFPVMPKSFEIELADVRFRYSEDALPAVNDISFRVPEGEFVAIVGPSGAGKSTLVSLLARLWDVSSGSVKIGGKDLREIGSANLNKCVGTVFQDVQMLSASVRDNIRMGSDLETDDDVIKAAEAACCHEFIADLPHGYDTHIGEGGQVHLSGGQKQRISLARAIFKDPKIVLLDEATCYADADSELRVQEAFSNLMAGKTVVVIAHRLSTIVNADRILVVNHGEIEESGTHDELLGKEGLYAKMWAAHTMAQEWKIEDKREEFCNEQ